MQDEKQIEKPVQKNETFERVLEMVNENDNILVTLSKDPSVDEMAAAIALTLSLDRMGKHATAIYSGRTPNALQFLEPDKTFEKDTNSLQDFIIALDKEKADHLRYKIEGDFVKVYITPYRTTLSEKDLEFSHGDFNVDLVIALNVAESTEFDAALSEYGRIMHDAGTINISNVVPGRLGGLEWNNAASSSISEMVLDLLEGLNVEKIGKDVATALLTGIVSATERFSNDRTTSETMAASAKLMGLGADQQLVAAHIEDIEKEKAEPAVPETPAEGIEVPEDDEPESKPGEMTISHDEVKPVAETAPEEVIPNVVSEPETLDVPAAEALSPEQELEKMIGGITGTTEPVMEELKTATSEAEEPKIEEPVAETPVSMPETPVTPEVEVSKEEITSSATSEPMMEIPKVEVPEVQESAGISAVPTVEVPVAAVYNGNGADTVAMNDKVMEPLMSEQPVDYGAMMDEELKTAINPEVVNPAAMATPVAPAGPEVNGVPQMDYAAAPVSAPAEQSVDDMVNQMVQAVQAQNRAEPVAMPVVEPVAQPVAEPVAEPATMPVAEPLPMPAGVELPPPPAPDFNATMPPVMPEVPASEPMSQEDSSAAVIPNVNTASETPAPEAVNPVVVQPVSDPSSFKIPGM